MHKLYNISVTGGVQGTGFRPFVYRIASEIGIRGYVQNTTGGVKIMAEGDPVLLDLFVHRIEKEKPATSSIASITYTTLPLQNFEGFSIKDSALSGTKKATVLADMAVCRECIDEVFDPQNRRFQYPFTNCTHCGPRYSIIQDIPYDRINTSMAAFAMCSVCSQEYHDPANRRFHAQPNACPDCGPQLALWDSEGTTLAIKHEALLAAARAIREGKILALKGIGGFQLLCDARNAEAVNMLRQRKHRPEKPFALLYPHPEMAMSHCKISDIERELLSSVAAPIVLLKKKGNATALAGNIAPGNPFLGIMLPCFPYIIC